MPRFWRVRQGLLGLLRRRRVAGWAVEVLVGHATFAGLAARGSLCCFHAVYRFIRAQYYEPELLWASARRELEAFCGLMILLVSPWWLPWNREVQPTDASESGWGIATSMWEAPDLQRVGRLLERARFKRTGGASAREAALASAGLERGEDGCWRPGAAFEDLDGLEDWAVDPRYEEVPARLLAADRWRIVRHGRWEREEKILRLEARVVVKAAKRLSCTVHGSCIRQVFLSDNMSVVLAFERARCRNFELLVQLRVLCSV